MAVPHDNMLPPVDQRAAVSVTVISERELVRIAGRLRRFLQDPRMLWVARRDPDWAVLQGARIHVGADAAAYFGPAAILAAAVTDAALVLQP